MEHLSKTTIAVTLNVYVVKIFSNTIWFGWLFFKRKTHCQSQSFIQSPNRSLLFTSLVFWLFLCCCCFFHFAKWKEKVFWWYDSEIRYARKLIYLKYETVQLVFTCSKSTKETLEGGGKHVHKKIKNYVTWLHVILVFSYIGTHFSPCLMILWVTLSG